MIREVIVQRPIPRRPRRPRRNNKTVPEIIGSGLGSIVSKGLGYLISGFGDYKVNENTLMTGGLDPPQVVNAVDQGGVIIRHREYLKDILASINFSIEEFPLNPGLVQTFPWLSNVAQHFEQYKFRGVLFEFKTLSSDTVLSSATSSALGSVIMSTQYNALLPPFPDKFTMENYEFANSSKPSISFLHPVECMRGQTTLTELYVRGSDAPDGSDKRLYDLGNFYIATVGMQAASGVAGELWVTYEIELYKPKIASPLNIDELYDHWYLSTSATNTNPFTAAVHDEHSTFTGAAATNTYTFPKQLTDGLFLVFWHILGTSTLIAPPSITITNCNTVNLFTNNTSGRITTPASTLTRYFDFMCVDLTHGASASSIAYVGGTYPASPTSGDLFIVQLPSNVVDFLKLMETDDDDYLNERYRIQCMIDDLTSRIASLGKC